MEEPSSDGLGLGLLWRKVHKPDDEPDEEFMEWYTRHNEASEWHRLEGSNL